MFKFIHAADLHLDSPLRGLERYEGAPVDAIRQATRKALQNLVNLAIDEKVDFVLIAGDLYDGDWQDYNTGLFFTNEMRRLKDAEISVIFIAGNHDAANKMTKSLVLPDNVEQLPTKKPKTTRFETIGVAVHGQGFAQEAVLENLSLNYPMAEREFFNIGLLHTNAVGSSAHPRYAECSVGDLKAKDYDYWALGHIHKPPRPLSDSSPRIVYSGNTQGRHIGEAGKKGCELVRVNQNRIESQFEPLDVFRWEICDVDATDAESSEAMLDRFESRLGELIELAEERPLAVRVKVSGACKAHSKLATDFDRWSNEIRNRALICAADQVWVEKVRFKTQPPTDTYAFYSADGAMGELVALIGDTRANKVSLHELGTALDDLRSKIPPELRNSENLKLDDNWIAEVLENVEPMLATLLMESDT